MDESEFGFGRIGCALAYVACFADPRSQLVCLPCRQDVQRSQALDRWLTSLHQLDGTYGKEPMVTNEPVLEQIARYSKPNNGDALIPSGALLSSSDPSNEAGNSLDFWANVADAAPAVVEDGGLLLIAASLVGLIWGTFKLSRAAQRWLEG